MQRHRWSSMMVTFPVLFRRSRNPQDRSRQKAGGRRQEAEEVESSIASRSKHKVLSTKYKSQSTKFPAIEFQSMTTLLESVNPLRSGTRLERTADPCIIVIFGATGDLTRRKLLPALYRLARQRLLPAEFAIVGTSRNEMSDDEFRRKMREALD